MLETWKTDFKVQKSVETSGEWVREETLLHITLIQKRMLPLANIQTCVEGKVEHNVVFAMDSSGWKSAEAIREATVIQSSRVASKLLEEIWMVLHRT